MNTKTKKPEDMTWADIRATLAKLEATVNTTSEIVAQTSKSVDDAVSEMKGIVKSNRMVSETYFLESLNESKTFGGVHFDIVSKNMKGTLKLKDGAKLEWQYDVVMINDTAVCIVEVKYRLRADDVQEVVDKHVNSFKKLFPMYEGDMFYLAVGGMTIDFEMESNIVETAKRLGVGVMIYRKVARSKSTTRI